MKSIEEKELIALNKTLQSSESDGPLLPIVKHLLRLVILKIPEEERIKTFTSEEGEEGEIPFERTIMECVIEAFEEVPLQSGHPYFSQDSAQKNDKFFSECCVGSEEFLYGQTVLLAQCGVHYCCKKHKDEQCPNPEHKKERQASEKDSNTSESSITGEPSATKATTKTTPESLSVKDTTVLMNNKFVVTNPANLSVRDFDFSKKDEERLHVYGIRDKNGNKVYLEEVDYTELKKVAALQADESDDDHYIIQTEDANRSNDKVPR